MCFVHLVVVVFLPCYCPWIGDIVWGFRGLEQRTIIEKGKNDFEKAKYWYLIIFHDLLQTDFPGVTGGDNKLSGTLLWKHQLKLNDLSCGNRPNWNVSSFWSQRLLLLNFPSTLACLLLINIVCQHLYSKNSFSLLQIYVAY